VKDTQPSQIISSPLPRPTTGRWFARSLGGHGAISDGFNLTGLQSTSEIRWTPVSRNEKKQGLEDSMQPRLPMIRQLNQESRYAQVDLQGPGALSTVIGCFTFPHSTQSPLVPLGFSCLTAISDLSRANQRPLTSACAAISSDRRP
jgi:hypothetical protein